MNRYHVLPAVMVLLLLLVSACEDYRQDDFETEYVVEGYLFAGEPLPSIRLSRTVPVDQAYRFDEQAVSNATMILSLLDASEQTVAQYTYGEQSPGIYQPPPTNEVVLPTGIYQLEISFANDNTVVRSRTVVPDTFSIVSANLDTVVYQATEQLEIDVTDSFYPGRQNVFIFSSEALEATFANITPFILDIFEPETEEDLEELRINESPPINEENYDRNTDGTLTIRYPWIAVNFFGPNIITASAIDQNILEFINSSNVQTQGSTFSPGEIPAVVDNIENGTGVFGSYAQVVKNLYIVNPRNP